MTAMRDELRRLALLWAEGLLCRCCHAELATSEELDAGICLGCVLLVELVDLADLEDASMEGGDSCL